MNMMRIIALLSCLICFLLGDGGLVAGFPLATVAQLQRQQPPLLVSRNNVQTLTFMDNKGRRKSNKRNGINGTNSRTKSGSGGGFANASTRSTSSKSSQPPTTSGNSHKVRSVSGFAGSGTKPLRAAANAFDRLRKEYGKECCHDVYVRSPLHDEETFWFVGKIARCTNASDLVVDATAAKSSSDDKINGRHIPTPQEAALSQKRLILEYAKRELRPQNMGGKYERGLELWLAPGDSEMDVVQNKVTLVKVEGSTATNLSDGFHVANVGFNPEIYIGDEVQKGGLRVKRDSQGRPMKPAFEINESA